MELTAEQRGRLPKYALEYIDHLECRLAEAQARIAKLSDGPADSNVRVTSYGVHPDRLLGRDAWIVFDLEDPPGQITVHHHDSRTLDVAVTGDRSDALHISPRSGNSVRVRAGDWWVTRDA